MEIGRGHPLRRLFGELVERHFFQDVQVRDPRVAGYVSNLLTDFAHADNLYRLRDAQGRRLDDVGEMLLESDPLGPEGSFDRERAVRKQVGDFTLFMTGLFPEFVAARRSRRAFPRLDLLLDYVKAGKESYFIVSSFDQFEYQQEAPVFRRLSDMFELCVYGLNLVKQDLERFQRDYYQRLERTLGAPDPA
ncbi:MAG: hypothetical protein HYY26_00715 [Acidobacteria bacterium]|nr:hypothetical protein [Acidobacteriota bacterium]